jgi:hypothetical protein
MSELRQFAPGYDLAILGLVVVLAYYLFMSLAVRIPRSRRMAVASYEPAAGASPAVAAWLLECGNMPRAMAAALVNMAAKGYLTIEQSSDLFSVTKAANAAWETLEPEEDALGAALFRGYDCFDFDTPTKQLAEAVKAFRTALQDTTYVSASNLAYWPAWIISGLAIVSCMAKSLHQRLLERPHDHSGAVLLMIMFWIFGSFAVAVRTIGRPMEKIASRLPGSTAPRRPWTGADWKPFSFLLLSFGGAAALALMTTPMAGLITAALLAINACFYHALQSRTRLGREVLARVADYKQFITAVDADAISRVETADHAPASLQAKNAYAIAFHVDRGWGEQFVNSIADVIEAAEMFPKAADAG